MCYKYKPCIFSDASGVALVDRLLDDAFSSTDTAVGYNAYEARFDNEYGWVANSYDGTQFFEVRLYKKVEMTLV